MLEITKTTTLVSIIISLMSFIITQSLSISPKKVQVIVLIITGILTLFLSSYLLITFIREKIKIQNTFWKVLSKKDITIINDYLDKSIDSIKYELRFDIKNNYVTLSGEPGKPDSFMTQQASKQIDNEEINIKNLDQYLLSPSNNTVFLYGPPGSGKSTTLYKALMNYKEQFNQKTGYYIPVFIHANNIISLLNNNHSVDIDIDIDICSFLEATCNNKENFDKFINVCYKKSALQFVIIIDALDEFSEKAKRDQLFNFLASLLGKNKKHRWILSCREEEYKPYAAKFKKVSDVRIKPMNLAQVKELLEKKTQSSLLTGQQIRQINDTVFSIIENQEETFLTNPYYLSLWLYQCLFSKETDDIDEKTQMPSIRRLHEFELKREIARGLDKKGEDPIAKVDPSIFQSQQEILSVLSYHLLKSQLSTNSSNHGQLNINQIDVIDSLVEGYERLKLNLSNKNLSYDDITENRLRDYQIEVQVKGIIQRKNNKDKDFSEIANSIINFINTLQINPNFNKEEFVIIISSILEQAKKFELIDLDISQLSFSKFLNQRAGDYLSAKYLEETKKITNLIKQKNINFWFFRSLAIAIAISEAPDTILDPEAISEDPVLSIATINGLSLVQSNNKKKFKNFIQQFVDNLFLPKNFDSDPCAALRTLRIVTRLSLNDYTNHFTPPITRFKQLLKGRDASISDAVAITLMTYVSRNENNKQYYWRILFNYFLSKAFKFELSRRSLNSFINVIYKQVHFK